jgi:hypothetical protein
MIEYVRLAFATTLVLLPGSAVARALGRRSVSAVLAWSLASLFVAWAIVFAVHSSIRLAVLLLAAIVVGASAVRRRRRRLRRPRERRRRREGEGSSSGALAAGVVLGWLLWHVAGAVVGDGLFHEGRVRKLLDFGDLHLHTVDEFKDGGLHPGYAFPLWHTLDAVVAWLSGLDPDVVMRHESSLLAPVAVAVAYEAGVAVFRSRAAGVAVVVAQLAIFCFGPGHGGSFTTLTQPGAAARQLLVPAAIALFFTGQRAATVAVFGALALVHPTYAVFLLIPLLAVAFWEWRTYLAAAIPVGAVLLWLRPIVDQTNTHDPSAATRANDLVQYKDQLVISSPTHFRLAPEVFGRSGAVAVAALLVLPLCAAGVRERWGRFVLGGALIVLCLLEVPWLFVHFSNAVSLSQSRRAAGFVPFAFAFAAGAALLARRTWTVPLALAAGIALQRLWPGDFAYGLRHGGPAAATWVALAGGLIALAAVLVFRPRLPEPRFGLGAAAAVAFSLPVLVHGLWHWSPANPADPGALSARLVHNLRTRVPRGSIVIAPIQTSYRIEADAPLYVVAAPLTHVANTKANQPVARYRAVEHWVATDDPRVPARYGATWAIRRGTLYRIRP